MKVIHNAKFALYWAVFIELVAHGFFAMQAFLLGGFIGDLTLTKAIGAEAANWVGSILLAVLIGGAAFSAFVLGEYTRQQVSAYSKENADKSFIQSFHRTRWLVGGLEVTSMLFRCGVVIAKDGDYGQATITAIFGIILLVYAFDQAKVIHAVVNRPVFADVMEVQEQAGRQMVSASIEHLNDMSVSQLQRFQSGDVTTVDEIAESRYAEKYAKLSAKQIKQQEQYEKEQAEQSKLQAAKDFANRLLHRPVAQRETEPPFLKAVPGSK